MDTYTFKQNKHHSGNKNSYNQNNSNNRSTTFLKVTFAASLIAISITLFDINIKDVFSNINKITFSPNSAVKDISAYLDGDNLKVVSKDRIPVRERPNVHSGEPIAWLYEGDVIKFLGEIKPKEKAVIVNGTKVYGNWIKVQTEVGKEGWVFSGAITRTAESMVIPRKQNPIRSKDPIPTLTKAFEEVSVEDWSARCNGNAVKFFLTPFGNLESGTPLGQLYKGNKIVLVARTKEKELMARGNSSTYDYRYKFSFVDEDGYEGYGWIKGIYLDILVPNKKENLKPDFLNQTPVSKKSEVKSVMTNPAIIRKMNNGSVIAIYTDKNLGDIKNHYTSQINTEGASGNFTLQVCTEEEGLVSGSIFLNSNGLHEENQFVQDMTEMIEKITFSNKGCGEILIKLIHNS